MQSETDPLEGLGERVLAVAAALDDAHIPHAFGGAIAYNYVGEPRATRDIDINIFLPETESAPTLGALRDIGVTFDLQWAKDTILRTGQVRIRWDHVPVDLFFNTVPLHDAMISRVRLVPFRGRIIPTLSAEDLTLSKIAFNRENDWFDIRNILAVQAAAFDLAYTRHWLYDMFPEDDERARRFERLVAQLTEHGVLPDEDAER